MKLPRKKLLLISALLSFCSMFDWGYDNSYVNTAQDAFHDHFMNVSDAKLFGKTLSEEKFAVYWSAIVYAVTIGLILGTLVAPTISEKFGRKNGMILAAVWQILASCLAGASIGIHLPEVLAVARLLQGFSQGISMNCLTLLLQESSPTESRGFISTLQGISVAFSAFLGVFLGLPDLLGQAGTCLIILVSLGAAPALILTFAAFFVPETPKYLILTKYDLDAAEKSVEFYYGPGVNTQVILNRIQEEGKVDTDKSNQLKNLFLVPKIRGALFRSLLAVFVPVFAGILPLRTYSTDILEAIGLGRLDWLRGLTYADLGTIFMGLLFFISSLMAPFLIDSFGRRFLLLVGGSVSTLCLLGIAAFRLVFHYFPPSGTVNFTGYASLGLLWIYIIFLGLGPAPVQYFIAAELVPQHSRAFMVGLVTLIQQITNLVLGFAFLPVFDEIHGYAIIALFTVPAMVCLGMLYFKLPETKGREVTDVVKDLEDIYDVGKIISRNTSLAAMSPTASEMEMEFSFIEVDSDISKKYVLSKTSTKPNAISAARFLSPKYECYSGKLQALGWEFVSSDWPHLSHDSKNGYHFTWIKILMLSKLQEMNGLREFTDRTSIHAIPDTFNSKNVLVKLFWAVCFLACFGLMVGEIFSVIHSFKQNSVASRIDNVQQNSYDTPPILLCPGRYFNATKVLQAEISKEAIFYMLSFFPNAFATFSGDEIHRYLTNISKAKVKREIHGLASSLHISPTHYPEILSYLAFEWNEIIDCMFCSGSSAENKIFTLLGVCYFTDISWMPIFSIPENTEQKITLYFPDNVLDLGDSNTVLMAFGHEREDMVPVHLTKLRLNSTYQIRSAAEKTVMIGNKCLVNVSDFHLKICLTKCIDLMTKPCWNCSQLDPLYHESDPAFWCSQIDLALKPGVMACAFTRPQPYLDCIGKCKSSCETITYQISIFPESTDFSSGSRNSGLNYFSSAKYILRPEDKGKLVNSASAVEIFVTPQSIFVYKYVTEFEAYDYHSFISNIGGQFGLWCGISILSLVQVVFYLAKALVEKLRGRGIVDKDKNNSTVDIEKGCIAPKDHTWSFERMKQKPFVMFNPAAY